MADPTDLGDHEIDCDEYFRIAMKENLPALAAELRALRAENERLREQARGGA